MNKIRTIVKIYPRIIDQSDDSTKAEAEAEADKNNDTTSHDSSYNDLMSELHGALEELDVKSGSPINN